ncbi:MAG: PAS domain S-box protein [Gammaproteobacteria bacterium]|nr:MAG: PAS domain S-box protein [Gammaproteobacteria bacterium]
MPSTSKSAKSAAETLGAAGLADPARRFRLFVKAVQDYAIFILDAQGRVATWNEGAARMKGYEAEQVIGRDTSVFYPREDVERGLPGRLLKTAEEKGSFEHEGWRVRKDGSRFWASVSITALRDEGGTLEGFGKVTRRAEAHFALADRQRESELRGIDYGTLSGKKPRRGRGCPADRQEHRIGRVPVPRDPNHFLSSVPAVARDRWIAGDPACSPGGSRKAERNSRRYRIPHARGARAPAGGGGPLSPGSGIFCDHFPRPGKLNR